MTITCDLKSIRVSCWLALLNLGQSITLSRSLQPHEHPCSNWNSEAKPPLPSPLRRWVKFEEKVEEGGERWSKPHVSTLTLHSLFELRTCLQTGSILLDLEGYSLPQIVGESRGV